MPYITLDEINKKQELDAEMIEATLDLAARAINSYSGPNRVSWLHDWIGDLANKAEDPKAFLLGMRQTVDWHMKDFGFGSDDLAAAQMTPRQDNDGAKG